MCLFLEKRIFYNLLIKFPTIKLLKKIFQHFLVQSKSPTILHFTLIHQNFLSYYPYLSSFPNLPSNFLKYFHVSFLKAYERIYTKFPTNRSLLAQKYCSIGRNHTRKSTPRHPNYLEKKGGGGNNPPLDIAEVLKYRVAQFVIRNSAANFDNNRNWSI